MCLFIESIKLSDGVFSGLEFHQLRVESAFNEFYSEKVPFILSEILHTTDFPKEGIHKCRIIYNSEIQQIEFIPYIRKEIQTLKVVETQIKTLTYKIEDRSAYSIEYEKKGNCDDILMIRDGLVTDTSYANIAFFDGFEWFTPTIPLLYGTKRSHLLQNGIIKEKKIHIQDIDQYNKITLFNAMIEFGEIVLDINRIVK